jgi:hypothetical protein
VKIAIKTTTGRRSKVPKKEIAKVYAVLEEIRGRRGRLTPTVVAEEVTTKRGRKRELNPRHPLAKYFDDPDQAKWRWWIHQCQELIQTVYIFVESENLEPVRGYTSVIEFVPSSKRREYVYIPTLEALGNDRHREQLFHAALSEIDSWQRRYEMLRKYYTFIRHVYSSNARALKTAKSYGHARRKTRK